MLLGFVWLPGALGQAVPAGARAVVGADTLPVYAQMSVESAVRATLKRGDTVTIALVVFGSDVTWCAVVKPGETKRLGYASCEFLDPERNPVAPAPVPPAPMPAGPAASAPVPPAPVPAAATKLPGPR